MKRLLTAIITIVLVAGSIPAAGGFIDTVQTEDASVLDEATIVRDAHGVPHVYADTEQALWYANGYVQAEDRLWAMDVLRHLAYGEGASLLGPSVLGMDLDTRRNLYTEEQLQTQMADADQQFKDAVDGYADGVNRAVAEMHAQGEIPAEFPALQHEFEPWEPIDTVAVATFLLAQFGNGGGAEVSNAKLLGQLEDKLGSVASGEAVEEAFSDLLFVTHDDTYVTIPDHDAGDLISQTPQAAAQDLDTIPQAQKEATEAAKEATSFGLDAGFPVVGDFALSGPFGQDMSLFDRDAMDLRWGSNALLVAPQLSETGEALAGGGPQMGYFNPQVPYEVGLHGPGIQAEGMGVTGAPGVIIGTFDGFSLTVTSGISDQTDIVALPADGPRSYTWDGQTRDLDCRDEVHRVLTPPALYDPDAMLSPVTVLTQEVCDSHVGPIVSITGGDESPEWFFARKTSSYMEEVASSVSWLSVSLQDDLESFRSIFDDFSFTFNFHYTGVDDDGDEQACFHHVGRQPIRNADLDPRLPTPPGSEYRWTGNLTASDMPWDCNPSTGYYANWNNKPVRDWSSGDDRELWGSVHRVERLDAEFNKALDEDPNDKLDLDQVKGVLEAAATHDSLAAGIVPHVLATMPDPGANATFDALRAALTAWEASDYTWTATEEKEVDGEPVTFYSHEGHTVYDELVPALLEQVFGDELDDFVRSVNIDPRDSGDPHAGDHGQHNNPFAVLVDALEGTTTRDWCDDVGTGAQESCTDQVWAALNATSLVNKTTVSEILLTEEHKSPFTTLGLGPAYEISMTNRATFYHFHAGSDTTQSFATLPPGASGHVNAAHAFFLLTQGIEPAHMSDQLDLYNDFEFKHVPWTQADAKQGATEIRTLVVP